MSKVYLEHNPFSEFTKCKIDYEDVSKLPEFLKCWGSATRSFLQDWVEDFFQCLHDIEHDDEYEVEFFGLPSDYKDLKNARDKFCKENSGIKISLTQKDITVKSSEDRVKQLRELFDKMQKTTPYEELKSIKDDFNAALSGEEEIGVVATMSSGKSTLLNAILHQDLLPAKNAATTAVVAKIYNDKSKHEFRVSAYDKNGKFICDDKVASAKILDELNSNKDVADLKLFGNIPNINEYGLRVVLSDTPGPNNSADESHKQHTYGLIGQRYKPMILYILNAAQLQTNDDNALLRDIAQEMKKSGVQSKDRFIFVLNKADELEPEKGESVKKIIEELKAYLKQIEIPDPKIFPISAQLSKCIRISQNSTSNLTKKETKEMNVMIELCMEDEAMHLYKFAPLSSESRKKLDALVKDVKNKNDDLALADICSGVPALEISINEYIEKYAIRQKIKLSIQTFKNFLEEKAIKAKSLKNIKKSEQNREEVIKALESVEEKIEDGYKAKAIEDRINKFNFTKSANEFLDKERADLSRVIKSFTVASKEIDIAGAKTFLSRFKSQLENFRMKFVAQIDENINSGLLKDIEGMYEEYKNYANSLMSESSNFGKASVNDISLGSLVDINFDINSTFGSLTKTITEKRSYSTGNKDKAWFKPWTWLDDEYKVHVYYHHEHVFNAKKFQDEILQDIVKSFSQDIDSVKDMVAKNTNDFKEKFLSDIKKLKKAIRNNARKQIQLLKNKDKFEQAVEIENKNIKWLDEFNKKLDQILEIKGE